MGVLTGAGTALGANLTGVGPSNGTGILAAVVALVAVGVGKFVTIEIHDMNDPDLAMATGFTDEILMCSVAAQVAELWEDEGITVNWPDIPES